MAKAARYASVQVPPLAARAFIREIQVFSIFGGSGAKSTRSSFASCRYTAIAPAGVSESSATTFGFVSRRRNDIWVTRQKQTDGDNRGPKHPCSRSESTT